MKFKKSVAPPRVFIYWIFVYLTVMAFFALFRLIFMFRHWHMTAGMTFTDLVGAFFYGAKFDMVVTGYLLLPFILISYLPYIGFESSRPARKAVQIIMYAVLAAVFMLCLIDIEYFGFFGDHLGAWLWSYFDSFGPVFYSIVMLYPVVQYTLAWIALTAVFVFITWKFNLLFREKRPVKVINHLGYLVIMAAFLAVSIRGGVSLAPIDWGTAYHSNNYFANELSLNGIFTLTRNIYEYNDDIGRHNPSRYQFFGETEALKKVEGLVVSPRDSLIDPGESLKRLTNFPAFDGPSQNVVFIVMESWSAKFVGACGGQPSATPFFNKLADKSLFFENFYASGLRTNRGLLSVLCSFPSLPGRTVMKLYGSTHPFMSIADILKDRNYNSYFIYGGDLKFDNMGGFFRMKGFENLIGIDDFNYVDRFSKWGVPDSTVLERANKEFAAHGSRPFVAAIMTLSNHEPFELPNPDYAIFPDSLRYYKYLNTLYYSDCALAHFFDIASREEYFKNTIFVLVGDHGKTFDEPDNRDAIFRIASLIYTPGRTDITPHHITTICGQVDLLPTVLHLLGGPAVHESWGRDILGLPAYDHGFTFVNHGDSYGWVQDSKLLWEKVHVKSELFDISVRPVEYLDISRSLPEETARMQDDGRAMIQLEVDLVHTGKVVASQ